MRGGTDKAPKHGARKGKRASADIIIGVIIVIIIILTGLVNYHYIITELVNYY